MKPQRRLFWSVGLAYVATWVLISWLSVPALDSYGDMVENYAWSQTWAWGTFRHPPLFAWVVGAWFSVFATQTWAYYLLSYLNAGAGILGIVGLARLWLPEGVSPARRQVFELAVLLFAALAFPYSNLAAKFNADTVLLSLWPWTAYAFFASILATRPRKKWLFTLLLAVMAASAMLAKYYSALLLASLFLVSLSRRDTRRWYRTAHPYVAGAACLLLLLPHLRWQVRMGFPIGQYLESKVDPGADPGRMALFLLSGLYYLPVSWLAWLVWRWRLSTANRQAVEWAIPVRCLVLLTVLPALMTLAFNLFARIHLTTHWAIPIWYGVPALLAIWLLPHIGEDFPWSRFVRGLLAFWVLLLAGAATYAILLSAKGDPKYSLARQEMVRTIETRFQARFPGKQLSWAGGTWPESGAVAFFGTNHPRALPGFPDEGRAQVTPYEAWPETYGVVVCFASNTHAREGSHNTECESQTRTWLKSRHLPLDEETLRYRAEGWRFIRAQPKNVTVFWVPPGRTSPLAGSDAP